jgi:glycosyltransferase involved in cell wall biosynthesis
MTLPRISVITPSFNQGIFLERTIHSVLEQKYPNLQYIIIDGGSSDDSVEIIKKYETRVDYWVSETDKGQSDAINKGLSKANGEVVTWINSDDLLMPGSLMLVARIWNKNKKIGLVTGSCVRIGPDNEYLFLHCVPKQYKWFAQNGLIYIDQPGAFWRRDILAGPGVIDQSLKTVMDHDLWYRIVLSDYHTYRSLECTAAFRLHDTSKTTTIQDIFRMEAAQIRVKYTGKTMVGFIPLQLYRLLKLFDGSYARKMFRMVFPSKKIVRFLDENQQKYVEQSEARHQKVQV